MKFWTNSMQFGRKDISKCVVIVDINARFNAHDFVEILDAVTEGNFK